MRVQLQAAHWDEGSARFTDEDRSLADLCCSVAMSAHSCTASRFLLRRSSHPFPCAVFAFPGSWSAAEWFPSSVAGGTPFGDCEVDVKAFPSLRAVGCRTPARVSTEALAAVQRLLADSELQSEVSKAMAEERCVIFTGHSLGGCTAVLMTIWLLEHRAADPSQHDPFCVTFGSPLVGDEVFNHALNRENWSGFFMHFVAAHDIVPRISLAPVSAASEEFQAILLCLGQSAAESGVNDAPKPQFLSTFYEALVRSTICASTYQACRFMGCTNSIFGNLSSFIQLSPYVPNGTYTFLTSTKQPIVLRNKDTVLQLLCYFLQLDVQQQLEDAAKASLREHWHYESLLKQCFTKDAVCLEHLQPNAAEMCTGTALGGLQLGEEGRLCIYAAGLWEKQRQSNQARIDANGHKIQEALKLLNDYRVTCELRGLSYYDSFKLQKTEEDFNANVKRLELAGLWDEIIEMLRRGELPDGFEVRQEWVSTGTAYRRLVEPLDIANYYRHSKDEDTGSYLANGRPRRYKYTQNWHEHAVRIPDGSSSASCFWAVVEELQAEMSGGRREFGSFRDRMAKLESEVAGWLVSGDLAGDVILSSSSFVAWWKSLPEQHRLESCMRKFVYGEEKPLSL